MNQVIKIALSFILILSSLSCVSTTTIKALDKNGQIDKDVKIYVGGKQVGQGEAKYSDKKSYSIPYLELKKEGCKSQREKLDVKINWKRTVIGGLITGIGLGLIQSGQYGDIQATTALLGLPMGLLGLAFLFWTREYVPVQEQEFQCVKIA